MAHDTIAHNHVSDWRALESADAFLQYLAKDSAHVCRALLDPIVTELLAPQGRTILDLGCGDGYFSRAMVAAGAARVVGVDISAGLVERAKQCDPSGEYHVCDIAASATFPCATFDVVAANMMLMYVSDLDAMYAALARVLVPRGKLVMSIVHPCYGFPVGRWTADGELLWITQYFGARSIDKTLGKVGQFPHFHRPLSTYVNAARRHGLVLQALIEPSITRELYEQFAHMHLAQQLTRVPLYVVMAFQLQDANSIPLAMDTGPDFDLSIARQAPSPDERQAALTERCEKLATELAAMRASRSWRLTAPARWLAGRLRH